MMVRLKQSWLVWSLLLCLVLVNGLLAVPAVAHADHHAKHQAGTHSTGLCCLNVLPVRASTRRCGSPSLQFVELADTQHIRVADHYLKSRLPLLPRTSRAPQLISSIHDNRNAQRGGWKTHCFSSAITSTIVRSMMFLSRARRALVLSLGGVFAGSGVRPPARFRPRAAP